jgi:predicted AlkP superfamily pyrophosphatase or phosphodiesterase
MRFQSLGVALFAAVCLHSFQGAAQPVDTNRLVVLISLDGLGGHYLEDPKAVMPTLRALAAEGAQARMLSVTPSVTWPSHVSIATGCIPAHHGVVGNNFFDRETKRSVTLVADPVLDQDQIVKVPTIYDVAKGQGLVTAAVRWPASRNAKNLDWTVPDIHPLDVRTSYSTPLLVEECKKANLWFPRNADTTATDSKLFNDESCAKIFNLILEKHRPNIALLHLVDIDHAQHMKGPNSVEAYAAIEESDRHVRKIWDILKRDYPSTATLIVVSDHGFSSIKRILHPKVMLQNAGLLEVKGTRVTSGPVAVVPQGGTLMVYINDSPRDPIIEKVTKVFKDVEGVDKVVGPVELKTYGLASPSEDPRFPDMIVYTKDGYVFGDTADGALTFTEKQERRGSHGHNPAFPNLHASFIAWGAGIKPGVKPGIITSIDVAPTIARLLNVSLPKADGKAIDSILK